MRWRSCWGLASSARSRCWRSTRRWARVTGPQWSSPYLIMTSLYRPCAPMDKALVYETTDVGFDPQRGRLRSSGMRIAASRLAQWLRALAVVGSWDRFPPCPLAIPIAPTPPHPLAIGADGNASAAAPLCTIIDVSAVWTELGQALKAMPTVRCRTSMFTVLKAASL